jgi:hypothetical protein
MTTFAATERGGLTMERDNYPCDDCPTKDSCDGWEAQFCCTLCRWFGDNPPCEECDPMDI